jgi:hypothetical protein
MSTKHWWSVASKDITAYLTYSLPRASKTRTNKQTEKPTNTNIPEAPGTDLLKDLVSSFHLLWSCKRSLQDQMELQPAEDWTQAGFRLVCRVGTFQSKLARLVYLSPSLRSRRPSPSSPASARRRHPRRRALPQPSRSLLPKRLSSSRDRSRESSLS